MTMNVHKVPIHSILILGIGLSFFGSTSQSEVKYSVTDMGRIDRHNFTMPKDINNHGVVVGSLNAGNGVVVGAFIWSEIEGFTKIDVPIGQRNTKRGPRINDSGQIVYQSRIESETGETTAIHGFLWDSTTSSLDLGRTSGWGMSINNRGQVIGARPPQHHSNHMENLVFVWDATNGHSVVKLEDGYSRKSLDINDAGEVLGMLRTEAGKEEIFIHSPPLGAKVLDPPVSDVVRQQPTRINNQGQALVTFTIATGEFHPYLWSDGGFTKLPSLAGGEGRAYDMNNLGQVVGSSYPLGESLMREVKNKVRKSFFESRSAFGRRFTRSLRYQLADTGWSHATLWENGKILDLNDLIPDSSPYFLHQANAINDVGQVVCVGMLKGKRGKSRALALVLNPVTKNSL